MIFGVGRLYNVGTELAISKNEERNIMGGDECWLSLILPPSRAVNVFTVVLYISDEVTKAFRINNTLNSNH